jgi:hypothetical protein
MMIKAAAIGFAVGLLSRLEPSFPLEALPSFAFLVVAEVCFLVWSLRQPQTEETRAPAASTAVPQRRLRAAGRRSWGLAQTRSTA